MSESHPCSRHAERIADLGERTTRLESIIGESSAEGLRAEMSHLTRQIAELTKVIQEQRVAEAKRDGRIQGATWVGRLIWAVFGAGALAAFYNLIGTFGGTPPPPHQ